jgi:hypothetical protein
MRLKDMDSKTVGVSLNFDNTYRYEFTVKVPFEVPNDHACFRLTGANLIGQKFRLGALEARKAGRRTIVTDEAITAWIASLPKAKRVRPTSDSPATDRGQS